jgi:tyrosine-protein phosphatase YwqE
MDTDTAAAATKNPDRPPEMLTWLHPKQKKNVRPALFQGMTDVHTHLLPGVDDGAQDTPGAIDILRFMHETGVRRIYLTPHIMADLPGNTPEALRSRYETFLRDCPPGPELRLAAEYMMDAAFPALIDKGLLAMAAGHVLVETSYLSPPPGMKEILYKLNLSGYQPIIAHPERYAYMHENDCRHLKNRGYKLQLNLFSLAGAYGQAVRRNAALLLKLGLYDHVGSDVHHLDYYRRSLDALDPTPSQLKELERLAANNHSLW